MTLNELLKKLQAQIKNRYIIPKTTVAPTKITHDNQSIKSGAIND